MLSFLSHIPVAFTNFSRQISILNVYRKSYVALYRPLDNKSSKLLLCAAIILSIAAGAPLPIIGYLFSKIIDRFPLPEDELKVRLGQLMGVAITYFVLSWAWSSCWGLIGERIAKSLKISLVERVVGMDMTYFDTEGSDVTDVLTAKTQIIQLGTSEKVGIFIQSISYFFGAFLIGFILHAKLTGILFATVIPSMIVAVSCGTIVISKASKMELDYSREASQLAESAIHAFQTVQAFGAETRLGHDHLKILQLANRYGIQRSVAGALMLGSIYFIAYAANALAFWQGYRFRYDNQENTTVGAGTVYAVVFLILDASFVVGAFGPFIQSFIAAAAAGEKVFSLLDHEEPGINVYSDCGLRPEKDFILLSLDFQNISFLYPARPTTQVLNGLTARLVPGGVNGIVGSSGSGKSTLCSLLLRLYDPTEGSIKLNGNDLREYHIQSLRARIAVVDQNLALFSGTIMDNIAYGLQNRDNLPKEAIYQRCKLAAREAICDFVDDLPLGLQTVISSSSSSTLSGGQKQRICLARALVGNPSLLILDEFTSAMDLALESTVLASLKASEGARSRTTIIIAHRLSTIRYADKIMVMECGKLEDEGTHDELAKRSNVYKSMLAAQKFASLKSEAATGNFAATTCEKSKGDDCYSEKREQAEHEEQSHLSVTSILKRCISMNKKEQPLIVLGILASAIAGAIVLGEAVAFGNLIDILNRAETSETLRQKAAYFCLIFFALSLTALVSYAISGAAFGIVSERLAAKVRDMSLRVILRQDEEWFRKHDNTPHKLVAMITSGASHLSGLSGVILGTLFAVSTSVIGGLILAASIAWKIAIVLFAAVPVMLVAGFLRIRVLDSSEKRQQSAYNEAAAIASEACLSIRTVAALGREREILQLYISAIKQPYKEAVKASAVGNLMLSFSLSITYFVYAMAYWWGSRQVRNGSYSQRDFFIVLPALLFSAQAAGQTFSLAPEMTKAKAAATNIFQLHDQTPMIMRKYDQGDSEMADAASVPAEAGGTADGLRVGSPIEFRDVGLTYATRENCSALLAVNVIIEAGQFVALVGPSGAGKSSMITLIARFCDPTTGGVYVNNENIRNMSVEEYRTRLALVAQESNLFPGSISFNVSLGARPGTTASHEEIVEACKICGIHDYVMSLPEGYNSDCGQLGSKLSGGQRQRVTIARALIRKADILLLDEATSELDAQGEKALLKRLRSSLVEKQSVIMVAHRLASIQDVDCIHVFDRGKVVEMGKHAELMAFDGLYASLAKQSVT